MDSAAKPYMKYAITAGICLLIAVVYFFANIPLSEIALKPMADIMKVLSDAFFIPGMFALMLGLLLWVASEGALDGVAYLGSFMVKTLIPGKRSTIERYGDFVERRRGNRKKGNGFLCVVGLAFIALAVIFYGLFYV